MTAESLERPVEELEMGADSAPFVGRWRRLVSVTNWEKGKIIHEWREALAATNAPPGAYADEVWRQYVGGVSSQHVGRLRRVHERFGDTRESYAGLYWSHFQAAMDWQDAEMWLEGAVQNGWSVSQMRNGRWEALGAVEGTKEIEVDRLSSESSSLDDEDEIDAANESGGAARDVTRLSSASNGESCEQDQSTDEGSESNEAEAGATGAIVDGAAEANDDARVPPFVVPSAWPADLREAYEAFELGILRHKLAGWTDVAREEVLGSLNALVHLAVAAS